MTTPYRSMTKPQLACLDSVVVAGDRNEWESTSSVQTGAFDNPSYVKDGQSGEEPIALELSLRRGRLAAFTAIMVVAIAGLMFVFNHGVQVSHFDGSTKDTAARTKMLDDYNSYSGNIASVFGKPIEFFVTISAQVILLRFMADNFTRSSSSRRVGVFTLGLGILLGYLISNGFNALNVQLQPMEVKPKITAADLSAANPGTDEAIAGRVTNVSRTVSEASAKNPVANTILRSVVESSVQIKDTYCSWDHHYAETEDVPSSSVQFGFTPSDWQARVLQEAIEPKQLNMVVNPTNKTANADVTSADLPMNASLAADLLIYSLVNMRWFFPVRQDHLGLANLTELNAKIKATGAPAFDGPVATLLELLPANETDELARKEWFLRKSSSYVKHQFANATNTVLSDIGMAFSHVDVSPGIYFDSITLEFDMDPLTIPGTFAMPNGTRFTVILEGENTGAVPALSLIEKAGYSKAPSQYDAPSQVAVAAMCLDNGTETLNGFYTESGVDRSDCNSVSTSSLLVVSIGKRLVADAITQNVSANATGMFGDSFGGNDHTDEAVVTNLRKIYSFTVGRLGWEAVDLSDLYHAECATSNQKCMGLQLPLSSTSSASKEHVVVGAENFVFSHLSPMNFKYKTPYRTLAAVNELARIANSSASYSSLAGDVLLPHNIREINWDPQSRAVSGLCHAQVEDRLQQVVDNHHYMEHSLQPAYTAATFFLFQNGVVKSVVPMREGRETLAFDGNEQDIAVWVSTPDQNAWLTIAGCLLLVLGLGAAVAKATFFTATDSDPLAQITDPNAIARVMLDEKQFPPLLLNRHVTDAKQSRDLRHVDHYAISSLSLQQHQGERAVPV